MLSGSTSAKAVSRTLVKFTPGCLVCRLFGQSVFIFLHPFDLSSRAFKLRIREKIEEEREKITNAEWLK
jgi:hypothetical protein